MPDQLIIKFLRPAATQTTEYGYPVQQQDSFQVIVPPSLHGAGQYSVDIALALVSNEPVIANSATASLSLETKLADGSYVIRGTRTKLNVSRREDDFKLHYRASLVGEQTNVDYAGALLYVSYNGDNQPATVDVDYPLFEVTATGFRDITPIGTPARLQSLWQGGVNSLDFDANQGAAIGAYSLRCESVVCEPWYYDEAAGVDVYRISFTWIGKNGGWRPTIYYKDPTTGLPPYDPVVSNWSKQVQLYPEFDYNQAWPFGSDVGA